MFFCRTHARHGMKSAVRSAVAAALLFISTSRVAMGVLDTPTNSDPPIRQCIQNLVERMRTPQTLRFQEKMDRPWGSEVRDVIGPEKRQG